MKGKIKFAVGTVGIDLDLGLKLEVFGLFGLHFFCFYHKTATRLVLGLVKVQYSCGY